MIRSTRTIFLLAALWLVMLTAPVAAAATGWFACAAPATQAAKDGELAACPITKGMPQGKVPAAEASCCCRGMGAPLNALPSPENQSAAIADPAHNANCACSLSPVPPAAQQPLPVAVLPLFSAVALLVPPASASVVPSSLAILPQAPIRGPAAAPLRSPVLAPDAGRAPPATV